MTDIEPGWYDDGSGQMRWWDGTGWTEHTAGPIAREAAPPADTADEQGTTARGALRSARDSVSRVLDNGYDFDALSDTLWSATSITLAGLTGATSRLTADFLYAESGRFSTSAQQIRTSRIQQVEASQSITQKARKVGDIIVVVTDEQQRTSRVTIRDIPNFREGVVAINKVAHNARERMRLRDLDEQLQLRHQQQTLNINRGEQTQSMTPHIASAVAAGNAQTSAVDLNRELATLVELRDSGALTDEEFTAAKRRLLGL